jgi:sphingolipid delta-4 desaturase
LPELRRLAWDFYEPLPAHKSWPYVTWKFITDPSVGMFSRAKRNERGERIDPAVWAPTSKKGKEEGVVMDSQPSATEEEVDAEMTERGYGSDREESKDE